MAKFVCSGLPSLKTDWTKWKMFFCDERLVPIDHEDSTLRLYVEGLVGSTPLTKEQFLVVDTSLEMSSAARDYEAKVRTAFPSCEWPSFDLLLLGVGPDGHTASLFPGHSLLDESKLWIAPISDSPKPPPNRVTMTLPVINHSRACIFAMVGQSKASMLKVLYRQEYF
ncbi:UNVERIFIED_CONTAM: hypothetical protein GTU68_037645 [Idotea baltica]|nr:hypothetical protein [Idotea baltica]